jgi:hypothetical protein
MYLFNDFFIRWETVIMMNLITEEDHAATIPREATLKMEAAVSSQTLASILKKPHGITFLNTTA